MFAQWPRQPTAHPGLRTSSDPSAVEPQPRLHERAARTARGIALYTVLAALSACTQVAFQSPPSLPLLDCDRALVGDWLVVDPRAEGASSERIYLRVTEGCARWLGIEIDEQPGAEPKLKVDDLKNDMTLGFARAGEQRYVASMEIQKADPEPATPDAKPAGYVLAAYQGDGDGWLFRLVEPSTVAHLIIDDVIPGWLEKRDRSADGRRDAMAKRFEVYVFGDADSVSTVLQAHDLLGPAWLRLRPVDAATSERMSDWIAQATTETVESAPSAD